jgi:hypothetical protein
MSNGQPKTEDEWRVEFEKRGFSTVQQEYMNGNYFHGPARAYAHKWIGETEGKNQALWRGNIRWGRKAAIYSGLAAIFGALAVVLAVIQLIITWPHR